MIKLMMMGWILNSERNKKVIRQRVKLLDERWGKHGKRDVSSGVNGASGREQGLAS